MPETPLSWIAPQRPQHDRSTRWYVAAASVVALLVVWGIYSHSWSFVAVMVLMSGVYAMVHKEPPSQTAIALSDGGLQFGTELFAWDMVKRFWILSLPGWQELHVDLKKGMMRHLKVQLANVSVDEIRAAFTARGIAELENQKEHFLDKLGRICKI